MSSYEELIEFRNRLNESDYIVYEEDIQSLDRVLDKLEENDHEIAVLKKALELACEHISCLIRNDGCCFYSDYDDFIEQAEKELKDE